MAKRIPAEEIAEGYEVDAAIVTDPTEQDESFKIIEMLESIAGEKATNYKLYLHRASEKNKAVAAAFINKYPADTPLEHIFEEAQTKYKGGNFVLVVREGNKIFRKAAFSVEYDKEKDL